MQELDALAAWCAEAHPLDHPRLKRVVGAGLQRFDSNMGQSTQAYAWQGTLVVSTADVRLVTAHMIGSLTLAFGQMEQVRVSLSNTASADAWIGISGQYVGPEWAEDVHLDPGETGWNPDTLLFSTGIYMPGNLSHYDLQLWPTYAFGG